MQVEVDDEILKPLKSSLVDNQRFKALSIRVQRIQVRPFIPMC